MFHAVRRQRRLHKHTAVSVASVSAQQPEEKRNHQDSPEEFVLRIRKKRSQSVLPVG